MTPACFGVDTEIFYPPPGVGYAQARGYCRACPTRQACLDLAMTAEADTVEQWRFGMYGGLTPAQRAQLARRQGSR